MPRFSPEQTYSKGYFPSAGVRRMLEVLSTFKSGAMAVVLRAAVFDASNTPSAGALVTLVPEGKCTVPA